MKHDPVLFNDWHVVARSSEVEPGKLIPARLLEQDVVVWRSADGSLHAWKDQCVHRGTRLSLGRIEDDAVVCPYHGWTYDAGGRCVRMPARPSARPSKDVAVECYRVEEQYGLVWLCLGEPARGVDVFPEFHQEGARRFTSGPYVVEACGTRLIENFLDLSHFPFVHAGYLGDRAHTEVPEYVVTGSPEEIVISNCRFWQPQANPNVTGGSYVDYTYWVRRPLITCFTKQPGDEVGGRTAGNSLILLVSPTEEFKSTAWKISVLHDHATSDDELKRWNDLLFEQDIAIVESQRPKRLPLDPGSEKHQGCDQSSLAYRKWLKQLGVTCGTSLGADAEVVPAENPVRP